jgi:uncharacterized protein (TIGR00255 family)
MTGYGRASGAYGQKDFTIEVRSLNGKTSDVRMKVPASYRDKEIQIRKIVLEHAMRGKLECTMVISAEGGGELYGLNKKLFKKYYQELSAVERELDMPAANLTEAILKIPSVIDMQMEEVADEEWEATRATLGEALAALDKFRHKEGAAMYEDLVGGLADIRRCLEEIKPYEQERVDRIRQKLEKQLEQSRIEVDKNRYEQEILFYLEKLDVNEERVRLAQHCDYFMEILDADDIVVGKKLGFVAQEMGREINTLGAKAQHSAIQQLVVKMKDGLERIKEQVANVV